MAAKTLYGKYLAQYAIYHAATNTYQIFFPALRTGRPGASACIRCRSVINCVVHEQLNPGENRCVKQQERHRVLFIDVALSAGDRVI